MNEDDMSAFFEGINEEANAVARTRAKTEGPGANPRELKYEVLRQMGQDLASKLRDCLL